MASSDIARPQHRHHRVTTGCLACRQSHVKCDEATRACGRCVRLSKNCRYPPPLQARIFTSRAAAPTTPAGGLGAEVADKWSTSRTLRAYREWAERVFAAYFGYDFWTLLIPQVSHSSSVVRSAVISAASVLESIQSQSQDPNGQNRVREKHRMNVRAIIKSAEQSDPEFALLACLIFASCELVMGALAAGMVHLQAGSKILRERIALYAQGGFHRASAAALLSEHVLPMFMAYSKITSVYGIELVSIDEDSMAWVGQHDCAPIPKFFVTTDQAHAHLRSSIHKIFTQHSRQPQADFEHQETQLNRWTIAMDAFERSQGDDHTSQINMSTICLLRNQHRLAQVFLSSLSSDEEASSMSFEKYSFDFIWILAQYDSMKFERILANEAVEIISPLFIIATITKHKRIRDQAVRLLESLDRTEANWNSQSALRIAKELVAHEESLDVISLPPITQFGWPKTLHECLQNASGMWPLGYILTMTGRFSLP